MRSLLLGLSFLLLTVSVAAETVHVVQPGETLTGIAARTLGYASEWKRIAEFNGLANPHAIRIGQKLRIPGPAEVSPPPIALSPVALSPAPVPLPSAPLTSFQELSLVSASGEVEVVRGGERTPLEPGRRIRTGDTVRTASSSRALFAGMGGERYVLGPLTTVAFQEVSVSDADRRVVIRVDQGELDVTAPETPFMSRYLIETPSGRLNTRAGSFLVDVTPPDRVCLSVFDGVVTATLPRGAADVAAGQGLVMRTLELPAAPVALPSEPGLSVEPALSSIIVAAAGRTGQTMVCDFFRDRDLQRHVARRTAAADRLGVALTRAELPSSSYWITCRSVSEEGLSSRFVSTGPVTLKQP